MARVRRLNLLPPERRLSIQRQVLLVATSRFVSSLLIGLATLTVVGLLIITSSWVYVTFLGSKSIDDDFENVLTEYKELRSTVAESNKLLETVGTVGAERFFWSALTQQFLTLVPEGMRITAVRGNVEKMTLTINGVASTRSDLVLFEESVATLPWVVSLVSPLNNLVEPLNLPFTLELDIDPKLYEPESAQRVLLKDVPRLVVPPPETLTGQFTLESITEDSLPAGDSDQLIVR